jgi:hypothetical protein
MADQHTLRIREFNDAFRKTLQGGKTFFTAGVFERGLAFSVAALAAVRTFTDFDADNDSWGEHDFGAFDLADKKTLLENRLL